MKMLFVIILLKVEQVKKINDHSNGFINLPRYVHVTGYSDLEPIPSWFLRSHFKQRHQSSSDFITLTNYVHAAIGLDYAYITSVFNVLN